MEGHPLLDLSSSKTARGTRGCLSDRGAFDIVVARPHLHMVPVSGTCGLGRLEDIEAIVSVARVGPDLFVVLLLRGQYSAYATVIEPLRHGVLLAFAQWEAEQRLPVMLVADTQAHRFSAPLHIDGWAKYLMDEAVDPLSKITPPWSTFEAALRRLAARQHIIWGGVLQAGQGHTAIECQDAIF
jgi:hypothetical protein